MSSRIFYYFVAASLICHLLFLSLVLTNPAFLRTLRRVHPALTAPAPPSLTLLTHEQPPQFLPTLASQEVAKPDPNAQAESERNTALKSHDTGRDANSPLPSMTGRKGGLDYRDTPLSPQVNSNPSEASPAVSHPPTPPTPTQTPAATAANKAAPSTPISTNAVPLFPAPNEAKATTEAQTAAKPTPQTTPAEPSPPPSSASISQRRSEIIGSSTPDIGDPSASTKETEVGRYKAKLYRLIGSRWYLSVERNMTTLGIGEVHVKFYVRANGVIDQVAISSSTGRVDILETISLEAVQKASGVMEPFSDTLKQQLGDGYWDDITFTIY